MNENLISIVVPVRNEEKYIINCLKSILSFKIPKDFEYEIMVVDGNSEDKTLELVKNFISDINNKKIKIIKNHKLTQAHGLNIAIKNAIGSRILRLDAHCIYSENYLYDLIETSKRKNVENIGGIVVTKPGGSNYSAGLVQALTTHKFGVGDSSFRTEAIESESDTVPFGFFKKSIFDEIDNFDFIFVDCPPALGLLTINSLVASNTTLIPLQSEFFALEGLSALMQTIKLIQQNFNSDLKIEGILLTMMDKRNSLSSLVEKDVRQHFGEKVYKTTIPRNVKISEAPSHGKPALVYDTQAAGSLAYIELAKEVILNQNK